MGVSLKRKCWRDTTLKKTNWQMKRGNWNQHPHQKLYLTFFKCANLTFLICANLTFLTCANLTFLTYVNLTFLTQTWPFWPMQTLPFWHVKTLPFWHVQCGWGLAQGLAAWPFLTSQSTSALGLQSATNTIKLLTENKNKSHRHCSFCLYYNIKPCWMNWDRKC